MHNYVLQEWITIRGISLTPGQVITQGESGWLDLAPYQDVSFWLDCREFTGTTPSIAFQTSPNKEDFLFQTMTSVTLTTSPSNPYRNLLGQNPNIPLGRFVRWQLTGPSGAAWDCTFRVLVSCNALGL